MLGFIEDYRRMGIYRSLWEARWKHILENYEGYTIYAWCKDTSLPLLLEKDLIKAKLPPMLKKKYNFYCIFKMICINDYKNLK
jgi:hypothetical protein